MRISDWSSDVCSSDLRRWADGRTHPVRKTPRLAGAFSFMRSRREVSVAGQDAQVVGLQDRIDRGEERRSLAGLVASNATAVDATGLVGLGAALARGGAERRVLVVLALAAAARKHALCVPS